MSTDDIERWLTTIHGPEGQRMMDCVGQERFALQCMNYNQKDGITHLELFNVYVRELGTNPWSVSYDFELCNVSWWGNAFHANLARALVLDYIFYTPGTMGIAESEGTEWMREALDRALGGTMDVCVGILRPFLIFVIFLFF